MLTRLVLMVAQIRGDDVTDDAVVQETIDLWRERTTEVSQELGISLVRCTTWDLGQFLPSTFNEPVIDSIVGELNPPVLDPQPRHPQLYDLKDWTRDGAFVKEVMTGKPVRVTRAIIDAFRHNLSPAPITGIPTATIPGGQVVMPIFECVLPDAAAANRLVFWADRESYWCCLTGGKS